MKKKDLLHVFMVFAMLAFAFPSWACTGTEECDQRDEHKGKTETATQAVRTYAALYEPWEEEDDRYYYGGHKCAEGYGWNERAEACVKENATEYSGQYSVTSGQYIYRGAEEGNYYSTYDYSSYYGSCKYVRNHIPEGATIRARGDFDVYIVKYRNGKEFKRLVLNPQVFENYGHLRWDEVMVVDPYLLECFTTSDFVRSERTGKIYKLYPAGDYGIKRAVSASAFDKYYIDMDSIYAINGYDEDSYAWGTTLY
jgi:hypothetical protein